MRGNIEEAVCIVCGKKYWKKKKRSNYRPKRNFTVRGVKCRTCSSKCSKARGEELRRMNARKRGNDPERRTKKREYQRKWYWSRKEEKAKLREMIMIER